MLVTFFDKICVSILFLCPFHEKCNFIRKHPGNYYFWWKWKSVTRVFFFFFCSSNKIVKVKIHIIWNISLNLNDFFDIILSTFSAWKYTNLLFTISFKDYSPYSSYSIDRLNYKTSNILFNKLTTNLRSTRRNSKNSEKTCSTILKAERTIGLA